MSNIQSNTAPRLVSELPFFANVYASKPVYNRHLGQRKLFLSEMNLLNLVARKKKETQDNRDILFVYAGAAPCMHMGYLMDLYPEVKFLLVDPNEFFLIFCSPDIQKNNESKTSHYHYSNQGRIIYLDSNSVSMYEDPLLSKKEIMAFDNSIYIKGQSPKMPEGKIIEYIKNSPAQCFIIENYMTLSLSSALKNDHYYTVFMSDIRTNSSLGSHDSPNEVDILWNNSQMFNWVNRMNPDCLCHKFRMQYLDFPFGIIEDYMQADFEESRVNGIDFIGNFKKNVFMFFAGDIYLEPWVSRGSSETRLVSFRDENVKDFPRCPIRGRMPGTKKISGPTKYFDFPDDYVPMPLTYGSLPGILYPIKCYDLFEYDQKMLYHNRANKAHGHFKEESLCPYPCDCFDCILETNIWKDYGQVKGLDKDSLINCIKSLDKYLRTKSISLKDLHENIEIKKNLSISSNVKFVSKRLKK